MTRRSIRDIFTITAAASVLAVGASTFAQAPSVSPGGSAPRLADQLPPEAEGVGIVERVGQSVPMGLMFTDETGRKVRIGDYFESGKPVILTLNYYKCPKLCGLTLNGMVQGLNEIDWLMGRDYEIVTVSINPEEKPDLALIKKKGYARTYTRDAQGLEEGWHFLTGDQTNIAVLADAVGFGYNFNEKTGEYVHAASITFVSPDGVITQYINNIVFPGSDLAQALQNAAGGTVVPKPTGSGVQKAIAVLCFSYNPESGTYQANVIKLMKLAGGVTALCVASWLGLVMLRGSRRNPVSVPATEEQAS
jgi:protein SCO1/2